MSGAEPVKLLPRMTMSLALPLTAVKCAVVYMCNT